MGGLAKKIPITCVTLFCAGVAIAGIPPFSGHYSKDAILEAAYTHAPWMYWVGVITAFMTAFYVFRALFLCFFGEYRGTLETDKDPQAQHGHAHPHEDDHGHAHPKDDHEHGHGGIHESPWTMWVPLAILAVLSLGGGFINIPKFLEPVFANSEGGTPEWLGYVAIAAGFGGVLLAAWFYLLAPGIPDSLMRNFKALHTTLMNKYFVDELYDSTIVSPILDGSRNILWRVGDVRLIDGAVNGAGKTAGWIGGLLRTAQSGYIRNHAAWVVVGAILVLSFMGLKGVAK